MVATARPAGWARAGYVVGPDDRVFPADSPWNTPTPLDTVWYDHECLHYFYDANGITSAPLSWFVPLASPLIHWATVSDPLWTFSMPNYVFAPLNRNRSAETIVRRAPANLARSPDTDQVVIVIDRVTGDYIDVWNAEVDSTNRIVTSQSATNASLPGWAKGNVLTDPGAGTTGGLNDGTRAANYAQFAGTITGRDIDRINNSQPIDHALVVILPERMLKAGSLATSSYYFIAPATGDDVGYGYGPIKMGSRIGIPHSVEEPSGLSTIGAAMFNCLQTYGAFVGDFGGGSQPLIAIDAKTVSESDIAGLQNWNGNLWTNHLTALMRVADYQP